MTKRTFPGKISFKGGDTLCVSIPKPEAEFLGIAAGQKIICTIDTDFEQKEGIRQDGTNTTNKPTNN